MVGPPGLWPPSPLNKTLTTYLFSARLDTISTAAAVGSLASDLSSQLLPNVDQPSDISGTTQETTLNEIIDLNDEQLADQINKHLPLMKDIFRGHKHSRRHNDFKTGGNTNMDLSCQIPPPVFSLCARGHHGDSPNRVAVWTLHGRQWKCVRDSHPTRKMRIPTLHENAEDWTLKFVCETDGKCRKNWERWIFLWWKVHLILWN